MNANEKLISKEVEVLEKPQKNTEKLKSDTSESNIGEINIVNILMSLNKEGII